MTAAQALWWEQARSDWSVFGTLRSGGAADCHALHYLQMATEKLGKAYFSATGPPEPTHVALVPFLRALNHRSASQRDRTAVCLGLGTRAGLKTWTKAVLPLALDVERLAPSLAGDGPNPEYPWPRAAPTHCPATHAFPTWARLTRTVQGRQLLAVLGAAVLRFPDYA